MARNSTKADNFRKTVVANLMGNLSIPHKEAEQIFDCLKQEGLLRVDTICRDEVPIEHLSRKGKASGELMGESKKFGNFLINMHSDWAKFALEIAETGGLLSGIGNENLIYVLLKLFLAVLSASGLAGISLNENMTAIIMALQGHSLYKAYRAEESICMRDANRILANYGYDVMTQQRFSCEVDKLIHFNCIVRLEGVLILIESVSSNF